MYKRVLIIPALVSALVSPLSFAATPNPILADTGVTVTLLDSKDLAAIKGAGYNADTAALYAYNYANLSANYFQTAYYSTGGTQQLNLYVGLYASGLATQYAALAMYYNYYNY
jgi:hypothetical protein